MVKNDEEQCIETIPINDYFELQDKSWLLSDNRT